MKISIKKMPLNNILLLLFASFTFFNQSLGFDFYSHSVSYYFYNESIYRGYVFNDFFILPRYYLLSYLYETFSRIGIPLGYVSLFLVLYPAKTIFETIYNDSISTEYGKKIKLFHVLFILVTFLLVFFYSGLSLVLLWTMAYIISNKKQFIIASLFHPLGIIFFVLVIVLSKKSDLKYFFKYITCFIIFVFVDVNFTNLFTSSYRTSNHSLLLDLESLVSIAERISTKKNEIFMLFILLILYLIYKNLKKEIYLSYRLVLVLVFYLNFLIIMKMYDKNIFVTSFYNRFNNPVIYISWFDWGKKNLEMNYWELNDYRYK